MDYEYAPVVACAQDKCDITVSRLAHNCHVSILKAAQCRADDAAPVSGPFGGFFDLCEAQVRFQRASELISLRGELSYLT